MLSEERPLVLFPEPQLQVGGGDAGNEADDDKGEDDIGGLGAQEREAFANQGEDDPDVDHGGQADEEVVHEPGLAEHVARQLGVVPEGVLAGGRVGLVDEPAHD